MGEGLFNPIGHVPVFLRDCAQTHRFDQSRISLLLSGDDLVDDDRAAGSDGFLHRRTAGFADDQVMREHQLRHLIGPAKDIHTAVHFFGTLDEFSL